MQPTLYYLQLFMTLFQNKKVKNCTVVFLSCNHDGNFKSNEMEIYGKIIKGKSVKYASIYCALLYTFALM